jgi:hypothetical protein
MKVISQTHGSPSTYQEDRHSETEIHSLSQELSSLILRTIPILIFRLLMKFSFSNVTGTVKECPQHLHVAH